MTLWKNLVVALVAAFALAACSSSNDNGGSTSDGTPPAATGPTQAELDAERERRERAEAEAKRLQEEKEKAAMEAGAKVSKAVFDALSLSTDFTSTATSGVSSFPTVRYDSDKLEEGILETVPGVPAGDYASYVMSSQRGSVGSLLRTKDYAADVVDLQTPVSAAPGNAGYFRIEDDYLDVDGANNPDSTDIDYNTYIDSDSFKDSGQTRFMIEREGQAQTIPGTFDGASGTYICTGTAGTTCIAEKREEKGYTLSGGTWEFRLSSNDVKTVEPDTRYLVWGWWTRTMTNGDVEFGSFALPQGGLEPEPDMPLGGKATYIGKALGQYALYDPLPGQVKESGMFTANAELQATFGTMDELSGMLSGFMTASGEKDWTVELRKAGITQGVVGSARSESATTLGTVWEIGDEAAEAAGRWDARFYDDTLGGVPGTTPSDVAGTFSATYERTGRMAGAFAAEHDTK